MLSHKQTMLHKVLFSFYELLLKGLISLHHYADVIGAAGGTVFFMTLLKEPINHVEKLVTVGYGLLSALIVALIKVLFPNGLSLLVNRLKGIKIIKKRKSNKKH